MKIELSAAFGKRKFHLEFYTPCFFGKVKFRWRYLAGVYEVIPSKNWKTKQIIRTRR